ncbi:ATP-binding protein [Candidatus Palauibacter sp.]|uniref:ATP-binding protein n=1 Tax=Candidatus Palauibacter sp. TaxID=3101350 RepID=UPI003B5CF301
MSEGQRLEWKTAWRDDHLKSVCAFANADGGTLEIGRDDEGTVVGVGARERRRLLEELPNKLRDLLGVVAAMHVREDGGVPYLRIIVEPYPVAISYRGVYYQRSGSTNQILRGPALDRFLLGKTGRCWDGMPDPRVSLEDLDPAAMAGFRKRARKEGRLSGNALDDDDAGLIEKLRLTDGDYLTKASVLLFHRDPERFVAGAHVKVGYFRNEWDVRFHDVISGDLFTQVDKTMEVLLFKYLKAGIGYDGIHRVESYPMPESALREALLNAVVHRDYAILAPIQIRVHDDRLRIYNPGSLPEGWTLEKLLGPHPSRPYNPDIANAFFWTGEIESWGRGIDRVLRACRRAGTPEPEIHLEPGGLWFEFGFSDDYLESVGVAGKRSEGSDAIAEGSGGDRVGTKSAPSRHQVAILRKSLSARPITELMAVVGRKDRTKFRNQILRPMMDAGWVEMTIPDTPTSRKQRYRTTAAGRAVLAAVE